MKAVTHTKKWIEKVVIGLGLCPFAAGVYNEDKILYTQIEFSSVLSTLKVVQSACDQISDSNTHFLTAIVVLESGMEGFEEYLELMDLLTLRIGEVYDYAFQLASFHPLYQFENTLSTDSENYTNRSPYPMIHILLESEVSKAVDSHPDIHAVPIANIQTMRRLGNEGIRSILRSIE